MITIERSHDYALIQRIITHPEIYPYVSDDHSPDPADYWPMESAQMVYIVPMYNLIFPMGVFACHPHNSICYEAHTCILPDFRGERALMAAQASVTWFFENTDGLKVITHVPRYNRIAYHFSKKVGFKDEGINRASFLKDGVLHDQYLLGITAEENSSCQSPLP